jgi:Leucine-rich repeat (LRR) protein
LIHHLSFFDYTHLPTRPPPPPPPPLQLLTLYLYSNQLEGNLPSELGALVNLEHFDASENLLSGPIPPSLGGMANLRCVRIEPLEESR